MITLPRYYEHLTATDGSGVRHAVTDAFSRVHSGWQVETLCAGALLHWMIRDYDVSLPPTCLDCAVAGSRPVLPRRGLLGG